MAIAIRTARTTGTGAALTLPPPAQPRPTPLARAAEGKDLGPWHRQLSMPNLLVRTAAVAPARGPGLVWRALSVGSMKLTGTTPRRNCGVVMPGRRRQRTCELKAA